MKEMPKLNDYIEIYFEIINDCNSKYNDLVSLSCLSNYVRIKKDYYDIFQNLNKIIPWEYDKDKKEMKLASNDGILCFKNVFNYLHKDLNSIFKKHYKILDNIRSIRNGIEHAPHEISIKTISSGSNLSRVEFDRNGSEYIIESIKLKNLLYDIIKLYRNVLDDILSKDELSPAEYKKSYSYNYLTNFTFIELI